MPAVPTEISDQALITRWGLVVEGYARTHERLMAEIFEQFALPAPWFEVLLRLVRSEPRGLPMTKLAKEASLTSGGFTKLADRLEAAGLLERVSCPNDRRRTYARLTPAGQELAVRAQTVHADGLRRHVLGVLGEPDSEVLARLMGTLRDANSDCGGPADCG